MIEKKQYYCSQSLRLMAYSLTGFSALSLCSVINPFNHYISAVILVFAAIGLYIYGVLAIAKKNWLDIRAVFSFVWLLTIGLASLRLTGYQEEWQSKTWFMLALAHLVFPMGITFGERAGQHLLQWSHKHKDFRGGRVYIVGTEKRLFTICVVTTLIGLACFIAAILTKGTVPFFSSDPQAYVKFYTRFHIFSVAATVVSGLCYYTIKTQNISKWQKSILYLCIVYSTFVFPILVVSRGVFISSALSLTTAVFYLNKRRFWILLCCLFVMGSIYLYASTLRNLSDSQLNVIFEPSEIALSEDEDHENDTEVEQFQLLPKVAFLYSYLTVSHDNFNEAVQNSKSLSYGVRQFMPFNVIFRFQMPEIEETYLVRKHLNTHNFISDAYYDFHEIGVSILIFIWAIIFGAIQKYYTLSQGPFSLLALGNTVSAVALSFFTPWMSNFTHWLLWGTSFVLFLVCYVNSRRKNVAD